MRWSPDTCACVFEYEFDKLGRVRTDEQFKNVRVVQSCVRHSLAISPIEIKMSAIRDNWLRNDVRRIATSLLDQETDNAFFEKIRDSFDQNGVLHITIDDRLMSPLKQAEIQVVCDLQLGVGKVVVDGE